mmetsp:Transcript_61087/g.177053  ORF Transcript_61087/g.177053 Transcript_61087/m.177053 type:complete len:393 (+) Transcript_61087:1352-2530(+)
MHYLLLVVIAQSLQLVPRLPGLRVALSEGLAEGADLVLALPGARLATRQMLGGLIFDVLLELMDAVFRGGPLAVHLLVLIHADSSRPTADGPRTWQFPAGHLGGWRLAAEALLRGNAGIIESLAKAQELLARLPFHFGFVSLCLLQLAQALVLYLRDLSTPLRLALDVLLSLLSNVLVQLLHALATAERGLVLGEREPVGGSDGGCHGHVRPTAPHGRREVRRRRDEALRRAAIGALVGAASGEVGQGSLEGVALATHSNTLRGNALEKLHHLRELGRLGLLVLQVPLSAANGGNIDLRLRRRRHVVRCHPAVRPVETRMGLRRLSMHRAHSQGLREVPVPDGATQTQAGVLAELGHAQVGGIIARAGEGLQVVWHGLRRYVDRGLHVRPRS